MGLAYIVFGSLFLAGILLWSRIQLGWSHWSVCGAISFFLTMMIEMNVPYVAFRKYLLLLILAAIGLIDYYLMIIPDMLILAFILLSIPFSSCELAQRIISIVIVFFIYMILRKWKENCIGWGDVKLCMAAAFAYGYAFLSAMRYSILVGGVFALFILLTKRVNLQTRLPFAPWIVFAILFQFL